MRQVRRVVLGVTNRVCDLDHGPRLELLDIVADEDATAHTSDNSVPRSRRRSARRASRYSTNRPRSRLPRSRDSRRSRSRPRYGRGRRSAASRSRGRRDPHRCCRPVGRSGEHTVRVVPTVSARDAAWRSGRGSSAPESRCRLRRARAEAVHDVDERLKHEHEALVVLAHHEPCQVLGRIELLLQRIGDVLGVSSYSSRAPPLRDPRVHLAEAGAASEPCPLRAGDGRLPGHGRTRRVSRANAKPIEMTPDSSRTPSPKLQRRSERNRHRLAAQPPGCFPTGAAVRSPWKGFVFSSHGFDRPKRPGTDAGSALSRGCACPEPVVRRLRVLAFDPEPRDAARDRGDQRDHSRSPLGGLAPGPVGEYLEVVDVDPASGVFYHPVDLDHPYLLAQDGLAPSESNPQFHQQMVYAVAMTTIQPLRAGPRPRRSGRIGGATAGRRVREAVRAPAAHLPARAARPQRLLQPGEEGAALRLLPGRREGRGQHTGDGRLHLPLARHRRPRDDPRPARRRASALQRADQPRCPRLPRGVRRHRGAVPALHLPGGPREPDPPHARRPGHARTCSASSPSSSARPPDAGRRCATRWAAETRRPGSGSRARPIRRRSRRRFGAHDRGAILVAAVFRAFLLIYRARTADLFRIATQGTGTLPEGEIHPDLTARLAQEAARCADRVLQMCIRAIDYCPPVDITFGDFLRGVITADLDFSPEDRESFRIVFIESFREWGIYPRGVRSMGLDALAWPTGEELIDELVGRRSLEHSPEAPARQARRVRARARAELEPGKRPLRGLEGPRPRSRRASGRWLREGDTRPRLRAHLRPRDRRAEARRPCRRTQTATHGRDPRGATGDPPHRQRHASTDLVIEITQRRRRLLRQGRAEENG